MDPRFRARVQRQADRYFAEILPRFIDLHFRGRGYQMIAVMLDCHDSGAIEAILDGPPPTRSALRRAARVRRKCPLKVVDADATWARGQLLFGKFTRRSEFVAGETLTSFREINTEYFVDIFELGFIVAGIAEQRLDDEILLTILHEYIHYFESFLPKREQPLRAREAGEQLPPYSLQEAKKRDRRFAVRRATIGIIAALAALGTIGAIAEVPLPDLEDEGALDRLEKDLADLTRERDRLVEVRSHRGLYQKKLAGLLGHVAELAEKDASYESARALAKAKEVVSGAAFTHLDDRLIVASSDDDGDRFFETLPALAAAMPGARVDYVTAGRSRWTVNLKLRGVTTLPRERDLDGLDLKPPTFQSARGRSLRAALPSRSKEIDALRDELGLLRYVEAWQAALYRELKAKPSGSSIQHAAALIHAARQQLMPLATSLHLRFERDGCLITLERNPRWTSDPRALDLDQLSARLKGSQPARGKVALIQLVSSWYVARIDKSSARYTIAVVWVA